MSNPRDVRFDVVARDQTKRATDSAAKNLDRLRRHTDHLRASTADVREQVKRQDRALAGLRRVVVNAATATGRLVAHTAALASALGPAALGVVALVKAAGAAARSVAPLVAALPALAGGLLLVKGTILLAAPAMARAVEPVKDAFTGVRDEIGYLAGTGLRTLSAEFVKVNFPAIRRAMERIARAVNGVVRDVGAWVNSTRGQRAIRDLTRQTAGFTERLSGPLASVAKSVGDMAGRAAEPAFRNLGGVLERAAAAVKKWVDGITARDVQAAFDDLAGLFERVAGIVRMFRDIGAWMGENRAKVTGFTDALAAVGIVVGIASGTWIPALVGVITLLANHWNDAKDAIGRARAALRRFVDENPDVQALIDAARDAVDKLRRAFKDAKDYIQPHILPLLQALKDLFIALAPIISAVLPVLAAWAAAHINAGARVIAAWLRMATAVVRAATWVVEQAKTLARRVRQVFATAREWLYEPGKALIGGFVRGIKDAIRDAKNAIGDAVSELRQAATGPLGGIASAVSGLFDAGPGRFAAGGSAGFTTGGPAPVMAAPVVNVDSRVFLDGQVIAATARTIVDAATSRQAWRAGTGRRW